jgi:hypothetical protein
MSKGTGRDAKMKWSADMIKDLEYASAYRERMGLEH